MREDIMEILNYANNLNLKIVLETNATLLDKFSDEISKLSNLSICASVDGPKETHNIIRRNQLNFDSFEKSIKNLVEAKNKGIPVSVTCSVNKINHDKIYTMIKELRDLGLNNVRLRLSMPTNYAYIHWNILKLSKKDFLKLNEQIKHILESIPDINFNTNTIRRGIPLNEPKFFITPEGYVKPYPFIEEYIGDLKHESVKDILSKFKNFKLPDEEEKRMIDYLSELGFV